jgi:hemerythrin-like metal-binding protein
MTPIEIFPWSTNFETGLPLVDEQHKVLVHLLNSLVGHIAYQSEAPTIDRVFQELHTYAIVHFQSEEVIWTRAFGAEDPWVTGHEHTHAAFGEQVAALARETAGADHEETVTRVISFLTQWLVSHIIKSDKLMAKAVLAMDAGLPSDEAKVRAQEEMSGSTRILIATVMDMYDNLARRTVDMTREMIRRAKAEQAARDAQILVERTRDDALRREQVLRREYEKALAANSDQAERTRAAMERTIEALSNTLETRDPYTAGHQKNVSEIAVAIARELDLSPFHVQGIHFAALVHDIGKIQVPLQILCKPGRLDPLEMELIRLHPGAGYTILKDLDLPWPVADMVLQHHEAMDGTGYPNGLPGDRILLEARILTVADIVESMSSARPYRPALGIDAALEEITRLKGTRLDPTVVDACLRVFSRSTDKDRA